MSAQTRRKNACVVKHQDISGGEFVRQALKIRITPRARLTIKYQHPRCIAFGERILRDQIIRKFIIEIRDIHRRLKRMTARSDATVQVYEAEGTLSPGAGIGCSICSR